MYTHAHTSQNSKFNFRCILGALFSTFLLLALLFSWFGKIVHVPKISLQCDDSWEICRTLKWKEKWQNQSVRNFTFWAIFGKYRNSDFSVSPGLRVLTFRCFGAQLHKANDCAKLSPPVSKVRWPSRAKSKVATFYVFWVPRFRHFCF